MQDLVSPALAERMEERRRTAKPWKPWDYQLKGMSMMLNDPQCGLLLSPGLGKTSTTLGALTILLRDKMIKRALVVGPLRVVEDAWPEEISEWEDFSGMRVALLHGPDKEKRLRELTPEHQVVLINFEGLDWLLGDKSRVKALGADVLVVDESSKMKNAQTTRFRRVRSALRTFKRRYILTGSPRPKNYLDLWSQIYLLDQGAGLGPYFTHYRNRFFYPTGYKMYDWQLLEGADKDINEIVAPLVLRLDASDYLKLPKLPDGVNHYVTLPPAARKEYDDIEDGLMSTLFDQPLVNSAAARSRCAQIANGRVYGDVLPDGGEFGKQDRPVHVVHKAKVDALVDLYEELQGEPLLVSIGYHHDVTAIREALGKDIPCINSRMTDKRALEVKEDWNNGRLPILLGHPASMGHGLNMQKCGCRHVAYFNIPDDYDLYDQMFRRVWRQGNQADYVIRHHFVARDTVDEPKMVNLQRKGSGQQNFLDAMRDYATKRGYNLNQGRAISAAKTIWPKQLAAQPTKGSTKMAVKVNISLSPAQAELLLKALEAFKQTKPVIALAEKVRAAAEAAE